MGTALQSTGPYTSRMSVSIAAGHRAIAVRGNHRAGIGVPARGERPLSIAGKAGKAIEDVGLLLLLALLTPLAILVVGTPIALIVRALLELARLVL